MCARAVLCVHLGDVLGSKRVLIVSTLLTECLSCVWSE